MPFNPSDPRGSVASLLATRLPGGGMGGGGMGGGVRPPTPTPTPLPSGSRSGAPGLPPTPFGVNAGLAGPSAGAASQWAGQSGVTNPFDSNRWQGLQGMAAGIPQNPAFAGTGGNSPGVTVTPGITPSNYSTYFGQPPTSAADAPMASMYPQYTSVADPSGNTSWQGNSAATGIPFSPANSPGNPPDFGMGGPAPGLPKPENAYG